MKINSWIFIFFSLGVSVCNAEEVQQDKLYSAGSLVESSAAGVALTIPSGWQGAWPQGSDMFVLESTALEANIFMTLQQGEDEVTLKATMSAAIPLDQGVQLVPSSTPQKAGDIYSNNYSVAGTPQLSAFIAARVFPNSLRVAFIALSANASKSTQVNRITLSLVKGLVVKTPTASANTDSGADSWQKYLTGRYIARYYSGSGYSEEQHLWLCSDSRFYRQFGSGGFNSSGASGATSDRGQGYWSASGSTNSEGRLTLQYGAGAISQISTPDADYQTLEAGGEREVISVSLGEYLFLNGVKWLRGNNEYCN